MQQTVLEEQTPAPIQEADEPTVVEETSEEQVTQAKTVETVRPNRAWRRLSIKSLHLPSRPPLVGICTTCHLPHLGKSQARCQCKAGKAGVAYLRIG